MAKIAKDRCFLRNPLAHHPGSVFVMGWEGKGLTRWHITPGKLQKNTTCEGSVFFFGWGECVREGKEGFTHWHITAGKEPKKKYLLNIRFFLCVRGWEDGKEGFTS